jgi:hypothetical protein
MLSETVLQKAIEILIAKTPGTTLEQVAHVVRTGIELGAQLDRIERRIAAIELGLQFLARGQSNGHAAGSSIGDGTSVSTIGRATEEI